MPLLDLPNELLLAIANPLDSEGDINALVQTNRHFHSLLNSHLYKHNVLHNEGSALEWAAAHGILASVKEFIQQGARIQGLVSSQPLLNAARYGHVEVVAYLLSLGANPYSEEKRPLKRTPIQWAIRYNHPEVVKALIEVGVDPNERDKKGESLLHFSAKESTRNNEAATQVLIAKGAELESKNFIGETPLCTACVSGSMEVALCLIENGADINFKDRDQNKSLLHLAALKNKVQIAEMLLEKGVSIEVKDSHGNTPLHYACYNGCKQLALFLVRKGANMEAQSATGNRPLHLATVWETRIQQIDESLRVTSMLLALGASPEPKTDSGVTPLHLAMKKDGHILCNILLDYGADPTSRDHRGRTPLHYLPKSYCTRSAELLLSRGAAVQPQDNNGDTPLHIAASETLPDFVTQLLVAGADQNIMNKQNKTPIELTVTAFSDRWAEHLCPSNEARDILQAAKDKATPDLGGR
ncbi:hypothetical protein PENANT_c006G06987 [Penicillium antarcticum]|uniref:F-box domain-containing protein n=1 Tax=Penicillium antarcticum TaxID=416450 RepID=A0A1V6QEB1_9EURO|nr:uncharacterized protein N7508_009276 [Penicillium antarcticum]KAJ5294455.1 hypothetical protein N7508_009276 [Penicillium antarcticum]OQD87206.1 hypothetical protein PENANT_c006G06987 [Penicillium antarcticum]